MGIKLDSVGDLGLFGLNGHSVGIILKELVRRAIVAIRNERQAFEVHSKEGKSGKMDDVLTSADSAAQHLYVKSIRECFPSFGIVAEEDGLSLEPKEGCHFFITVDPLDGTKAFVRRQSNGVGTMIALVDERSGEVLSAYVGDVNTCEIYGFRPGSQIVHRISEFNVSEHLPNEPFGNPGGHYIILRNTERTHSLETQRIISKFKNVTVDGGSIGTWMARLWKREVAAAVLEPGHETPWDRAPIVGISKALGFVFVKLISGYEPSYKNIIWTIDDVFVTSSITKRNEEWIVVHRDDLELVFGNALMH